MRLTAVVAFGLLPYGEAQKKAQDTRCNHILPKNVLVTLVGE